LYGLIEEKLFDSARLEVIGGFLPRKDGPLWGKFDLYKDNNMEEKIWEHPIEDSHEEELLTSMNGNRIKYTADSIKIGEVRDIPWKEVCIYRETTPKWVNVLKNEKYVIEIMDRDFYWGSHAFYNELKQIDVAITIKIEQPDGSITTDILHYNIKYAARLTASSIDDQWVSAQSSGSHWYKKRTSCVLTHGSSIMLCPDGNFDPSDYERASGVSKASDKFCFFGTNETPVLDCGWDSHSFLNPKTDATEHSFLLEIVPMFTLNDDNNLKILGDTIPGIPINKIVADGSNAKKINFYTTVDHGFTPNSKVSITMSEEDDHGLIANTTNEKYTFELGNSDDHFTITYSDGKPSPWRDTITPVVSTTTPYYGTVRMANESLNRFINDAEDINSSSSGSKYDEYKALVEAKFGNMEVFKRRECKYEDRGKLVRWINEQLSLLNLPHSNDPSYYSSATYIGVIGLKNYFKGVNQPLYYALELNHPCSQYIAEQKTYPATHYTNEYTTLTAAAKLQQHCKYPDPPPSNLNDLTPCGCFTWGMVVFEEVMDFDDTTTQENLSLEWKRNDGSIGIEDSFASSYLFNGSIDKFNIQSTNTQSTNIQDIDQLIFPLPDINNNSESVEVSIKIKQKYNVYLRVDAVDDNGQIEGIWGGITGTFADYILEGNAEIKINNQGKITWKSSSGNMNRCKTPEELELEYSKWSASSTSKIRITIMDVRTTFGEWKNSGNVFPSEYGRIDGVTAINSLVNQISDFFGYSSGLKLTIGLTAKFGFEFSVLQGILQLKVGSIIGAEASNLESIDFKFGMFASAGVEAKDVFSAEAEIRFIKSYKIRFDNFLSDFKTMIWEEINGLIPDIFYAPSQGHKKLVKEIKQKNTRKELLSAQLDLSDFGLGSVTKSYEQSSLFTPTSWGSKTEFNWKDEFAYAWGSDKHEISHYREVKHNIDLELLTIIHSFGYKFSKIKQLQEIVKENNVKEQMIYIGMGLQVLLLGGIDHSLSSLGAFNTMGSLVQKIDEADDENKDAVITDWLASKGITVTGHGLLTALSAGILAIIKFNSELDKILDFSNLFSFNKMPEQKKSHSICKLTQDFVARVGFKSDYVYSGSSPPDISSLENPPSNPAQATNSIKDYINASEATSPKSNFHDILVQLGYKASIELDLPRTPFPPPVSFLAWRPVFSAELSINLELLVFKLLYELDLINNPSHSTNLELLTEIITQMNLGV
jgi:hypothetical protein